MINDVWKKYKLSELATFRRGSFPQPYGLDKWYDDDNGYPFIQVFDVGDNMKLKNNTKRKISDAAAEQSVYIKKGTLVLTIQGSIGRIAITHYDAYIDRTLLLFQSYLKPTDKKYLMYAIHRLFDIEKEKAHGSTIKTITKEQLSDFTIQLPPLPEQQKIAEILTTVDGKIELIDQHIEQTQELKKGIMQKLLTGQYKIEGNKIVKRSEAFKDSELGRIPESWEVKIIGEFAKVTAGGTPSTQISEYWNGDIRWMNSGEINLKRVKEVEGRITKKGLENSSTKLLPKYCILIALAGQGKTRGTVAINEVELCTNQSLASILPNPDFYPEYLYYNLDSRYIELRRMSTGEGGRGGLNLAIIRSIPVQLPTLEEQKGISEYLNLIDNKILILESKKSEYTQLKKGLMQKLLTGKIRVKV